jgi:hypothetical protein
LRVLLKQRQLQKKRLFRNKFLGKYYLFLKSRYATSLLGLFYALLAREAYF